MKRGLVLLLALFSINLALASPVLILQNENSTFQPGETILGEIVLTTGTFEKPITVNDVQFFKGRRQIFMDFDLSFYNETYFFYASPNLEGNITIKINNVLYKSPELASINIEKNIVLEKDYLGENKTQTKILSLKPGLFYTSEKPKLVLKNLGTEHLNFTIDSEEISLSSGDFKAIEFIPNQSFSYITVETYKEFKIPIVYFKLIDENHTIQEEVSLKTDPRYLHVNLIKNQRKDATLKLVNFAESNVTNISIATHNLSMMEFVEIQTLAPKSFENLSMSFYADFEGYVQGEIVIEFVQNNKTLALSIPVNVYIFPENTPQEEIVSTTQTCEEKGGVLCSAGQDCSGSPTSSSGGLCCLNGECTTIEYDLYGEPTSKGGSYGWLIGILIFVALGVGGFFAYKKYKSIMPKKPEEKMQQKAKVYEKRIKGGLTRT